MQKGPNTGPSAFFINTSIMRLKIISAAVICFILLNSFNANKSEKTPNLRQEIPLSISKSKMDFQSKADAFLAELQKKPQDKAQFKEAYQAMRASYKDLEIYFSYYNPDIIKKKLNGAPLPFIEENSPDANIIDPTGLQVIDELVETSAENQAAMEKLTKQFKNNVTNNLKFLPIGIISDRNILELYRINLFKILAMEISGFETPGTSLGIKDAAITLQSINTLLQLELQRLKLNPELIEECHEAIKSSEQYMQKSTKVLTEFDHFTFTRDHLQKLYRLCAEIHEISGIEYASEVYPNPKAINWKNKSLFSHQLLNKIYFSQVKENDKALIELGRQLFYEPLLSHNVERSCASCHNPQKAFTDGLKTSEALNRHGHIKRNSPSIANAIYATEYFSDLRAEMIVQQIEHVVFSPDEFGSSYTEIENNLSSCAEYKSTFQKIFKNKEKSPITKNNISTALSAFIQHQSSWNSDFDKAIAGEITNLSLEARSGYNLFMGKGQCGTCHFAPAFSGLAPPWFDDSESENLGILTHLDTLNPKLDSDLGKGRSSKVKERLKLYHGHFKTTSVRNVALTSPYMHNGSLKSIDEVLDFYNHGGGQGLGIEVAGQTLSPNKLGLNKDEKDVIKAFLVSLTDTAGLDLKKPATLPLSSNPQHNKRKVGGTY